MAAPAKPVGKAEPQSTARRDQLRDIERAVQKRWEHVKLFEADAPDAKGADAKQEHYLVTFPYPYMNGVLHLGHAFTLSKAEFAARFQRLKGKRVLFPFGFHCTGMPIAACADKLKKEVETYGNPPQFPPPPEEEEPAAEKDENGGDAQAGAEGEAEAATESKTAKPEEAKKRMKKGKVAKKKSKKLFQWEIMEEMGVPEGEIAKFQDAHHWLQYFPPIGKTDLQGFGLAADFRRSFITTDVNPYYDAFIRWHFNTLKRRGDKIAFGNRVTIYSTATKQPCADHDRASGEGVNPQEYTLIKLQLLSPFPKSLAALEGKKVFLPAATLRPETMYGQTNCWVLPDGEYGAFEMKDGSVFVTSARSALNMSYQDMCGPRGELKQLATVPGTELIGCAVKAPLTRYEKVYVLPLLTISMAKGTGIVTSVPSDAPDDYAALMDMRKKEAFRKKFHVKDEMVLPFDVIPIIEIPGLGDRAAQTLCEKEKVQSQNDRQKLDAIKEQVYKQGFYNGVMLVGDYKGAKVEEAKPKVRQVLLDRGEAAVYWEPESTVISRSGDECVVTMADQWYLTYGQNPQWKEQVKNHVENVLECYNPQAKDMFRFAIDWMREWACSRTYGLGTALPWDKKWVIESLSDSTIYMAYYTIAHFLQGGVLDGSKVGPAGIKADQLSDEVFNYVFLHKEFPNYPANCGIPQKVLDQLRHEFDYWYPMSLRVSGKDLINNHLTMSMYNHAAIWPQQPELWPRSFFTNGHVLVDAEKMSKMKGNFITMTRAVEMYSCDAVRLSLAQAGDGLTDANFDTSNTNSLILHLTKELAWTEEVLTTNIDAMRTGAWEFLDHVFDNDMNRLITLTHESFEKMQFYEAIKYGFHELRSVRDDYRAVYGERGMHRQLVERFLREFLVIMSPVIPHLAQHLWDMLRKAKIVSEPEFVANARWPAMKPEDPSLTEKITYLRNVAHTVNAVYVRQTQKDKKVKLDSVYVFYAGDLPAWQRAIVEDVKAGFEKGQIPAPKEISDMLAAKNLLKSKKDSAKAMQFLAQIKKDAETRGAAAFRVGPSFNEGDFLREHLAFIMRGTDLKVTQVHAVDDEASPPERTTMQGVAPGQPLPFFFSSEK